MDEYRLFHRGWQGKKYYMEMTREEIQVREKIKLALGVIFITPSIGILMAAVAGMI